MCDYTHTLIGKFQRLKDQGCKEVAIDSVITIISDHAAAPDLVGRLDKLASRLESMDSGSGEAKLLRAAVAAMGGVGSKPCARDNGNALGCTASTGDESDAGCTQPPPASDLQTGEIPLLMQMEAVWKKENEVYKATPSSYNEGWVDGYEEAIQIVERYWQSYVPPIKPVSKVNAALEVAAEILANFKGEKERPKIEEWEACYAMLFKQMNDLVNAEREPVVSKDMEGVGSKCPVAGETAPDKEASLTPSAHQPVGSSEALRLLELIDKAVEGYIVEHERIAEGNDEPGYSLKVWGSDRANLVAASKSHIPLLRELLKSPKRESSQPDEYRPHPNTSLEVRIDNVLHRLNLDRPDIVALKNGQSIQRNIADDRWLAALLIDMRSALKRESVKADVLMAVALDSVIWWRDANGEKRQVLMDVCRNLLGHFKITRVEDQEGK